MFVTTYGLCKTPKHLLLGLVLKSMTGSSKTIEILFRYALLAWTNINRYIIDFIKSKARILHKLPCRWRDGNKINVFCQSSLNFIAEWNGKCTLLTHGGCFRQLWPLRRNIIRDKYSPPILFRTFNQIPTTMKAEARLLVEPDVEVFSKQLD